MGYSQKHYSPVWLPGVAAAFVLFAGAATAADTTAPQLVNFSISPASFDTSSGAATLTVSITAQDDLSGFSANATGNGIVLTHESGTSAFGRQNLPITGGTASNPVFQFTLTVPQFSPAGMYRISITLADAEFNTATFGGTTLQGLGFPSTVTATQNGSGFVTLNQSATDFTGAGGSGSVLVTASSTGFTWSAASNASWLNITSGTTGTGTGTVNFTVAANGTGSPRTASITVSGQTLTVLQAGAGSNLNLTSNSLAFTYQTGGAAPPAKLVTAYSSGAPLSFTASVSSVGNWLFVGPTSGVTSTVLNVWVEPASLSPGTYTGLLTVTAAGPSNNSQSQIVTLVVSSAATVTTTPTTLSYSYQQGGSIPSPQIVAVAAGSSVSFAATASSTGGWLAVSPPSGTTPSSIGVSVSPVGMGPGTYTGSISIAGPGSNNIQLIPVTLIVTAGQTISSSPSSLSFTHTAGATIPVGQGLLVSGTASGGSFAASASSAGNWLTLGASTGTIPGVLSVSVNPSGLVVGVYSGAITLTAGGTTPRVVPVTLIVTQASFTATPPSLTFRYQPGGALPSSVVSLSAAGAAVNFAAASSSGGDWLSVSPSSGVTPATLIVSAAPQNLAPGSYQGSISTSAAGAPPGDQTLLVTLIVEGGNLSVSPGSLEINYQTGDSNPIVPGLSLSSSGAPAPFTVTAASTGNWLAVSPASGSTPATLTVQVNPTNLAPGSYTGTIQISSSGLTPRLATITLNVRAPQNLTLSANSLAFSYQIGGLTPAAQTLTLGCAGSALSFAASASSPGAWLTTAVPNTGANNNQLIVSVNPAGLGVGSHSGAINILGAGACNKSQTVPVTLSVNAAVQTLTLSASSLFFSYQVGAALPAVQTVAIGCGTAVAPFSASATSNGGWLRVSPMNGSTPATLGISVEANALTPGTYSGSVAISIAGACSGSQVVNVSLAVAGAPQTLVTSALSFGAGSLSFSAPAGGLPPAAQIVSLSCSGVAGSFTATASSNGGWLSVSPASGTTTGTLTVAVNATGLAIGSYSGSIAVTLTVAPSAPASLTTGLTIAPAALTFNYRAGAANSPSQTVTITGGAAFTAVASSVGGWLLIAPMSGVAPTTVTVSVNPAGLPAGTYTGVVIVASGAGTNGASQSVGVTLTISGNAPPPAVSNPLSFTYQSGGPVPAPQSLTVGTDLSGPALIAATSSPGSWLAVSPTSATAPANVTVSVNPTSLAAGIYTGAITTTLADGSAGSQTVVTLEVTVSGAVVPVPPTVPVVPRINSLVNAASLLSSPLAPGEIISIFGSALGPSNQESMRLVRPNQVGSLLAGTRVIIDGQPAPVLFTQSSQVNAIVPFSVAGRTTVQVQVEFEGVRTTPASFSIADAAPAIFSIDGSGRGQAALLNEDTSVNSDLNPADRGSIAVLYAVGAGQMAPAAIDGAITGTTLPRPVLPVSVLIDGQNATVLYAGAAPGLVAGVLQVNFRLPPQVRPGTAVGMLLKVGRFTSQAGVTLAIR